MGGISGFYPESLCGSVTLGLGIHPANYPCRAPPLRIYKLFWHYRCHAIGCIAQSHPLPLSGATFLAPPEMTEMAGPTHRLQCQLLISTLYFPTMLICQSINGESPHSKACSTPRSSLTVPSASDAYGRCPDSRNERTKTLTRLKLCVEASAILQEGWEAFYNQVAEGSKDGLIQHLTPSKCLWLNFSQREFFATEG